MKILFLLQGILKGGAERLALETANEIQNNSSHDVLIVALDKRNEYPNLIKNLSVKMIDSSVQLSITGKNKVNINEYEQIVDDYQPDVIHSHTYKSELVSRENPRKNIVYFTHVHSDFAEFEKFSLRNLFNKEKMGRYFERIRIFKKYNKAKNQFITISKSIDENLKNQLNVSKHKDIHFLPNAIPFDKFKNNGKEKNLDKIRIINVGRFQKNKNQKFLLDIVCHIKNKSIPVECVFIGGGAEKENILLKSKQLLLDKEVFFLDVVNNVEEYYHKSNIYCHCALKEAFGLVLLEAMAAGLPVITLDGEGNRDIIEQGKNGYLFAEQNAEVFANKIIEVWSDKEKYKKMSQFSQEYASGFDIKNYCNNLITLYQSYLIDQE